MNIRKGKANHALQHLRADSLCMWMCLESFMTEVPIIQKPVHSFAEQINGLVYIRQERVNACIYYATCIYLLRYIP